MPFPRSFRNIIEAFTASLLALMLTNPAHYRMESMSLSSVVQAEYKYNNLRQQVIRRLTQAGQTIHNVFDMDGQRLAKYDYENVAQTLSRIRQHRTSE